MVRIGRFIQKKLLGFTLLENFNRVKGISLTGFTLIELVIVFSVLVIISVAAITAFQNITEKAEMTIVRAALKSVRSAIVIQRARNEARQSNDDGCHQRINFLPTFEEVRRASYESELDSSILQTVMPSNPLMGPPPANQVPPRSPSFSNDTFVDNNDCGGNPNQIVYSIPEDLTNPTNNLVVATDNARGSFCVADPCKAAWAYNPYTGEFWANSSAHGSNNW